MEYVKKQHYVPRFYLKNFTFDVEQKILFCYDKITDTIFKCNIKDIAQQNRFYESDILEPNEIDIKIYQLPYLHLNK